MALDISNIISRAPCLLDDLMDNDIIKCDIAFGTSSVEYNAKESPSHQSDSGVSEMSDDRSTTPNGQIGSPDFLDLQSFTYGSFDDEIDDELASYFVNAPENVSKKAKELSSTVDTPSSASSFESVEVNVPHKSKINDKKMPSSRVLRGKARAMIDQADLLKLNEPISPVAEPQRIPAIKVVKVVKPPMGSSKEEIDNQVFQALDERNRKNAIQAKLNREKKKQYIQSLEGEIASLRNENCSLKNTNASVVKERDSLLEEVEYLKSVLANQSALSGLLKNIGNVRNVKLSSSVLRKRSAEHDHDYGSLGKKVKSTRSRSSGVCLHVDNDSVSLEFCSRCAGMAKSSMES